MVLVRRDAGIACDPQLVLLARGAGPGILPCRGSRHQGREAGGEGSGDQLNELLARDGIEGEHYGRLKAQASLAVLAGRGRAVRR